MSVIHGRVTWSQQFCTRVLGLNPSSAASLLCALGKFVPFSGPRFLLQTDDTNSPSITGWYAEPLCPTRKVTSTGVAQSRHWALLLSSLLLPTQGPSHDSFEVCAHWPTMEVHRQLIAPGLRPWVTEDNLSMALSLTASSLEDSAAGRLRLREGRATLKVTQHSSSRQDETLDLLLPLPMEVTVSGIQGRWSPFPSPPHLFLPFWVTPATLPSICANGWLQARSR